MVQHLVHRAAGLDHPVGRQVLGQKIFAGDVGIGQVDVGDVVDDAALMTTATEIARKLADYVEQGHFESWIFRIAINRLRDEMRRRKLHARPMDSDIMADIAPQKVAQETAAPEELRALRDAMDQLPDLDREIIDLRHQGGMTFQQIAVLLAEPMGTLLARHHRAIRKLRDLMRRHMGDSA